MVHAPEWLTVALDRCHNRPLTVFWRCDFHHQQLSCSALSASTSFATRLLVFEALLSVLETGLLGNAVCKADEVVEVDRAVAEETFFVYAWLEAAYVGSMQDCALLCKNGALLEGDGPSCIGFRSRLPHDETWWGECELLFEDNGSGELQHLHTSNDNEKYYSIAGCL
jgi:hypothetical protein